MPETNDAVVRTVRLTKVFRDFWLREKVTAVADLDLEILPREVFGLLGPNGSGKSTTLKMILGLLFATRGQIAVFGRRASDVAVKSRIGFLPEESYLYPFLDAHETLDFYGSLFHQPRRERRRRIGMLLDMVGLSGVAYRRVGEYSKGMQRRIGLAQALINDPDLLILDEPTSGMDPIGTRQFKDLIRTLAARGKTVLLSSHLLADVEDICDRVCILYGGRKRDQGTLHDLLGQGDKTQIITDRLDERTLEVIEQALASSGRNLIEVTTPRDKLESLFLRIVSQAQQQHLSTAGSVGGGEVAEFLRTGASVEGKQVIERLVAAAGRQDSQEAPTSSLQEEPPELDTDIIEDLVTAAHPEHQTPESPGREFLPQTPQVDRSVIDGLMDDRKQDGKE